MRYLVFDLQCYYDHGHWIQSAVLFKDVLNQTGSNVKCYFPKHAANFVLDQEMFASKFISEIEFGLPSWQPYRTYLSEAAEISSIRSLKEALKSPTAAAKYSVKAIPRFTLYSAKQFKSKKHLVKVLAQIQEIDGANVVVPTADNFAANVVLLKNLIKLGAAQINLRFVNSEPVGVRKWIKFLRRNRRFLAKIKIGVENEILREMFENAKLNSFLVPYPPKNSSKITLQESSRNLRLAFLGAPRETKGYNSLPKISEMLFDANENNIFVAQLIDPNDEVSMKLNSWDNFKALPKNLDRKDFVWELSQADALILPYERQAYKNTSSALLMEAADYGTPCIVPSGTGLASEVARNRIGWVYENDQELFEILVSLSTNKSLIIEKQNQILEYNKRRRSLVIRWAHFRHE